MNEQELNIKLAKWRWPGARVYIPKIPNEIRVVILGQTTQYDLFTESLDACFKWLKSKFVSMACGSLNKEGWKGSWAKVITSDRETSSISEEGIEPALAICLAIEKLIDNQHPKSE